MTYYDGLKTIWKGSKSMVDRCKYQSDHIFPLIYFLPAPYFTPVLVPNKQTAQELKYTLKKKIFLYILYYRNITEIFPKHFINMSAVVGGGKLSQIIPPQDESDHLCPTEPNNYI